VTWWQDLYDDAFADALLDAADPGDTAATVSFLLAALELAPGDRVLDQCAGTGRLAVPLARAGLEVIAVEQSARYVERARAAGVDVELHCADATRFVPPRACDAALNWWTSFGYLPDDDGNLEMLRRAREALVAGGRFALDFHNVAAVLRRFRAHEVTEVGGIVLARDSRIDLARGVLHKQWTVITPDGRRVERPSAVRLYTPDQLAALVARAGFIEVRLVGGITGEPLDLDSPRCIVLARRAPSRPGGGAERGGAAR
jgi:SAM-dependent methyltransferase